MDSKTSNHAFQNFGSARLKAVPLSELVHSNNRLSNMRAYVNALCNVLGAGEYTQDQVEWVQGYLLMKRFVPSIVDRVDKLAQEATAMPEDALVWETAALVATTQLQDASATLIHDMLRMAAANSFPEPQMNIITKIATEIGIADEDLQAIALLVKKEQDILHGNQLQFTTTATQRVSNQ